MRVFLPGAVLIPTGIILGIIGLTGLNTTLVSYYNSTISFRVLIIVLIIALPFFGILILPWLGRKRITGMKTAEEITRFINRRRGNIANKWDKVQSASLQGYTIVL